MPLPGPGHYDPPSNVKAGHVSFRKVATAAFQSQRKDLLFSGNEIPGPGQYTTTNKGEGKNAMKKWQTNIGAFGSTEKRFVGQPTVSHQTGSTAASGLSPVQF